MRDLLPPIFGAANAAVDDILRQTRLSALVDKIH